MISQTEIVAKLNKYFNIENFPEGDEREFFPSGYDSIFERFAVPGFWHTGGLWNGLMLDNAANIERVYLVVFPSQDVLDTIIAREVERGAPGALIFCHHMADYHETGPGYVFVAEPQLEELREHQISYYVCHAPLDTHPKISTSASLAEALKLKSLERFATRYDSQIGVFGKIGPISFGEFARKAAEVTGIPQLRYSSMRNNARPVNQVAVVAGAGGDPKLIQEAIDRGCDTFVTGEWWFFGSGEWRGQRREAMRIFLRDADINLIGTSHYASEAVVMREQMLDWFRSNVASVEAIFVPQGDPLR